MNDTSEPGGVVSAAPHDDLRPVIHPSIDDGAFLRTALKLISAVASIALHAGAAAAMLVWFEPKPGVISMATEAITVELVASDVIEAITFEALTATSAAASAPDVRAGSEHEAPAREQSDKVETSIAEPAKDVPEEIEPQATRAPTEMPVQEPEPTQANDDIPAQMTKLDDALSSAVPSPEEPPSKPADELPVKPEPAAPSSSEDAAPARTAPKPQATRQKTEASAPSRKGGAPSRRTKAAERSPARASASAGDAINYAAIVQARVASRRPVGPGHRGTVQIMFGISPSGALASASILRSSGDASLDQSVLAAVRSAAPFPPPPAGASPRQRSFSLRFRAQ